MNSFFVCSFETHFVQRKFCSCHRMNSFSPRRNLFFVHEFCSRHWMHFFSTKNYCTYFVLNKEQFIAQNTRYRSHADRKTANCAIFSYELDRNSTRKIGRRCYTEEQKKIHTVTICADGLLFLFYG